MLPEKHITAVVLALDRASPAVNNLTEGRQFGLQVRAESIEEHRQVI